MFKVFSSRDSLDIIGYSEKKIFFLNMKLQKGKKKEFLQEERGSQGVRKFYSNWAASQPTLREKKKIHVKNHIASSSTQNMRVN